jgi:hypothetical protein
MGKKDTKTLVMVQLVDFQWACRGSAFEAAMGVGDVVQ